MSIEISDVLRDGSVGSALNLGLDAGLNLVLDPGLDPEQLTNKQLIERCRLLGSLAVKSRRMFVGLLPLIERRRAYDVKKFSSVFHFASVVGGVSYHLTEEVLRLDAQLSEFLLLRRLLYRGEIGWSKIRAVLSLVTVENEERWVGLLKSLPRAALIGYVRDFKKQDIEERGNLFSIVDVSCESVDAVVQSPLSQKNCQNEADNFAGEIVESGNDAAMSQASESTPSKLQQLLHQQETFSVALNSALVARLRLFRQKLEKQKRQWITWEQAITELLNRASDL